MLKNKKKINLVHWAGIVSLMLTLTLVLNENASYLNASLIPMKTHQPYDGLSAPIKLVPDWAHIASKDRENAFNDVKENKLINLPLYNPDELTAEFATLTLGDPASDAIRTNKILYSVPYLGNYKLDGQENAGSHPAIDIKVPTGTPIYAIGNGIVAKVTKSTVGFGNVIVLKHTNFPNLEDSEPKYEIYSVYAHLSEINVSTGDIVERGKQLGLSGKSGLTTTPHLHFQIDNSEAPWHPYWPYTYKEAADSGMDFTEALNAGLGKERAMAMTINPMKYVQKYLSAETIINTPEPSVSPSLEPVAPIVSPSPSASPTSSAIPSPIETPTPVITPSITPSSSPVSTPSETPVIPSPSITPAPSSLPSPSFTPSLPPSPVILKPIDERFNKFEFETPEYSLLAANFISYIKAFDVRNNFLDNFTLSEKINVEVEDPNVATLLKNYLEGSDFIQGYAPILVIPKNEGKSRIKVEINGINYYSKYFSIISAVKEPYRIKLEHNNNFRANVPLLITLQLLDREGNPTPVTPSGLLKMLTSPENGSFDENNVSFSNFNNGKFEITYIPTKNEETKIIASGGAIYGESIVKPEQRELFTDISSSSPYFEALAYLKEQGVISGTGNNMFKPDDIVRRGEFIKMLIEGFKIDISSFKPQNKDTFSDVLQGQWFYPYIEVATALKIISGYDDGTFRPERNVNRAEFIKILLETAKIKTDDSSQTSQFDDVKSTDWFAPYANKAKALNLKPFNGNSFKANDSVTRGEAALAIYGVLLKK